MNGAVHVFPMYAFVTWTEIILPLLFSCNFITIAREDIFITFLTFGLAMQEENKNYPRLWTWKCKDRINVHASMGNEATRYKMYKGNTFREIISTGRIQMIYSSGVWQICTVSADTINTFDNSKRMRKLATMKV